MENQENQINIQSNTSINQLENMFSPIKEYNVLGTPQIKNEGKADDNEETIKKRLDTFEKETKPIVEYFEKQGNLIKIDGMKTVDEISKEIGDKFKEKGLA